MNSSFAALSYGLIFAVVLVYLLMVINFQSWLDPLIILMALPGALSGILWMLFITGTTISVPALMGAIMSIGVATANSILVITFANDQRQQGMNAHDAALAAGTDAPAARVIMTALAMIIGMLPMSLGLGEGGEQNAPLGPRRHRRIGDGDVRHAVLRAGRLQQAASEGSEHPYSRRAEIMESNETIPKDLPKIGLGKLALAALAAAIIFAAVFVFRYQQVRQHTDALDAQAQQLADQPPVVDVAPPKPTGAVQDLTLPGNATPMQETALYARVNGYLKRWMVDIGAHVEAGQLLAEIDAPDLDAQLNEARAAVEQANANAVARKRITIWRRRPICVTRG